MTIQLDDYEKDILDSVERGEWQSVANLQHEIDRYRRHAIAFTKSQINLGNKAMLKTYEAIIQDGQVQWLAEKPDIKSGRVFITVLEEQSIATPIINKPLKQDLLNFCGAEPDAQDIPRRRMES